MCLQEPSSPLTRPAHLLPCPQAALRKDFSVAAQNCWKGKGGAFTGELRWAVWGVSVRCGAARAWLLSSPHAASPSVTFAHLPAVSPFLPAPTHLPSPHPPTLTRTHFPPCSLPLLFYSINTNQY